MATESTPTQQLSNMEMEEENKEEQRVAVPEDGYEWRKYGQKFIKNIGKFRSYFKCQKQRCMAKKRVEWSEEDASNVRVVYDGVHNHQQAAAPSQGSSTANQYNLLTQILQHQPPSSPHNPPPPPTL